MIKEARRQIMKEVWFLLKKNVTTKYGEETKYAEMTVDLLKLSNQDAKALVDSLALSKEDAKITVDLPAASNEDTKDDWRLGQWQIVEYKIDGGIK